MKSIKDISVIHIVPYSHHDHAWTNTRQWHIWRYIEGFCRVLDEMNRNPAYTYTIDNVLHSLDVFYRYCPSRAEEFAARVKEGRICAVNGGMALARPADFDGELLIRNGCAGRQELMRRFGLTDIPVYWNADTSCGASQMPQLLRLMGHRYYRFQRPEATLKALGFPGQFRWRGMDGTEITVSRGMYGGCTQCGWDKMDGESWPERRNVFIQEELSESLTCAEVDQLLINVGQDDCFPLHDISDRPYRLTEFMHEWNQTEPSRMEYSSLARFFEAIDRRELPVWQGPIDPCELSFNANVRAEHSLWQKRMHAERLLLICERLDYIESQLGAPGHEADIRRLWNRLFAFSGHAMQHLLDTDYDEVRNSAAATVAELGELQRLLMDEIAMRTAGAGRVSQVLVNPTLNGGERIVELSLTTPSHIDGLRLTDADGRELSWQLTNVYIGDKPYKCQFNQVRAAVRVNVPPMGYTTVRVECDGRPLTAPASHPLPDGYTIDNGVFRAVFHGGLIASAETADGLVAGGIPLICPRFTATEPTDNWLQNWKAERICDFVPERAVLLEDGPLRWRIETRGRIASSGAVLTQTICAGSPVIDCLLELDNSEQEGFYTLELPCTDGTEFPVGVPFGEERVRPGELLYADEAHPGMAFERGYPHMFYANGYISVPCGAGRLLLLQGDASHFVHAEPGSGRISQLLYRPMDLEARTEPWMTHANADMDGRGLQRFSFGVAVLPGRHDMASAQALLQEQRAPVLAQVRYSLEPGDQPAQASLLCVVCDHVQLSAAYRSGNNLYVRLVESGGYAGQIRIGMPAGCTQAEAVDLTGSVMNNPVTIEDGAACTKIRAHEIMTLRFR